jgi:hypothetical protein
MSGLKADADVRVEVFPRVRRTFLNEFLSKILSDEELDEFARVKGGDATLWNAWARRAGRAARLALPARPRAAARLPAVPAARALTP